MEEMVRGRRRRIAFDEWQFMSTCKSDCLLCKTAGKAHSFQVFCNTKEDELHSAFDAQFFKSIVVFLQVFKKTPDDTILWRQAAKIHHRFLRFFEHTIERNANNPVRLLVNKGQR